MSWVQTSLICVGLTGFEPATPWRIRRPYGLTAIVPGDLGFPLVSGTSVDVLVVILLWLGRVDWGSHGVFSVSIR